MTGAVLVTGATGFVGRILIKELAQSGRPIVALVRHFIADMPPFVIQRIAGPIEDIEEDHWMTALEGVEVVVHLAAIAHIGKDVPEDRYDAVNHCAVTKLGHAAVRAGVKRIVFMSSIRAQTGVTSPVPVCETSLPTPTDAYGRAKFAAEIDLKELPLDHVILRPVVIVGPAPKGNLVPLLWLAKIGFFGFSIPLPFASLGAKRSMVSLADVVATTIRAIDDPAFSRRTIILADPEPLGLGDMICALRAGLGMKSHLFACPAWLLALPFRVIGRTDLWERIGGTMIARPDAAHRLGIEVQVSAREALRQLGRQALTPASRHAGQSLE